MRPSTRARAARTRLAVAALGGVATAAELAATGIGRSRVASAVASGDLVAHGRGVVAVPGAPDDLVIARRSGARPACLTAARSHGLPLLVEPARPHLVSVGHRSGRTAVWHRAPGPRAGSGQPVDLLTAVEQVVRCRPAVEALVVVDAALRAGRIEVAELAARFPARTARRSRWVVEHADARSESVLESALRCRLLEAGITDVRPQVWVPGVGRVDFLVDGWLVVEADGFGFHSAPADHRRDSQRVAGALGAGMVTLRFGYGAVVHAPDEVVQAVQAARRRVRPGTGHFRTRVADDPTADQARPRRAS